MKDNVSYTHSEALLLRHKSDAVITRLESLGYICSDFYKSGGTCIATALDRYMFISDEMYDHPDPMVNWKACGSRFDCGDNEDMFIALAALSNVTDKHQWFILPDGKWYLCLYEKYLGNGIKADRYDIRQHFTVMEPEDESEF